MSKNKPDHLMSSQTEKKIMEACVAQGLRHLAMSQSTEDAFSQQEKLEYKHNSLLASSLLCFTTEEEILKDWQAIDWSLATQAPDLIAYSGNKVAISRAPIEWDTLKTASHEPKIHNRLWEYETPSSENKEYFWIVQKMLIERMEPFGAFTTDHRISDIGVRNNEVFWDTLLDLGKVSAMSTVTSKRYPFLGEITLLDMALLYDRSSICNKMVDQFHPNKEQALKTLLTLAQARPREKESYSDVIAKISQKCLNLFPPLATTSPVPIESFCGNILREQSVYQHPDCLVPNGKEEDVSYPINLVILSSFFHNPSSYEKSSWKNLISYCQKSLSECSEEEQEFWLSELGRRLNPSSLSKLYDKKSCLIKTLTLCPAHVQSKFLSEMFKTEILSSDWSDKKISHKLQPLISFIPNLPQATLSHECFVVFVSYIEERLKKEPQATLAFSNQFLHLKKSFSHERFGDLMECLSGNNEKAVLGVGLLHKDLSTNRHRPSQLGKKM